MRKLTNLTAIVLSCVLATGAVAQTRTLKVLGQPGATGEIQKNKEGPFFQNFADNTGLDVNANFQTLDQTGVKGAEELRILKSGLFDIISLRLQQVSRDAPAIMGLDLVGLNTDYDNARETMNEFGPVVDKQLQENFNTKLLGLWPFGPQVLFCNREVSGLSDLKGAKVRTDDQTLSKFVESIGAIPVQMGFSEVYQSLARGVVDCAITGPSSANASDWPEVTTYVLPLSFRFAVQGYGMNLKAWNSFSPEDQQKIQAAFDGLVDEIWAYSEELYNDAMNCNVGKSPCELNKPFDLTEAPVSKEDLAVVSDGLMGVSFPAWAEVCDANFKDCSQEWMDTVGKRVAN
ncbi:TRAP transporter substrate-binding protein [uncultured Paracoccus sp.]|jgi:TRAP-type C4-dicarboxylate transport system substrate-binding protein|uniref:TRAP transporter substrate-binding protein n=1 Tax=uncultured Paracoccus sp. TaxID=189685 RepID=UPI00261F5267|nr:TRAP transporter substrate-binding protein [uncultured Paracoccus sp.]|tara:strand:+ start:2201 stop:3238 length:1038 start_codon:yes stop_codon:yes gene_type:complete